MNQPLFLHIVERLEGFLGKLPDKLQKPILHELTPLKELFLKQREPRVVLTGSHKFPVQEVFAALFASSTEMRDVLVAVYRWQNIAVENSGTIALLDARGADADALKEIENELRREPADVFLHLVDGSSARPIFSRDTENLASVLTFDHAAAAKVIGISVLSPESDGHASRHERAETRLPSVLSSHPQIGGRFLDVVEISIAEASAPKATAGSQRLMSLLARELPNEARIKMVRLSRDQTMQEQIAQQLIKSTTAICGAIGMQPIPLADLPILTTLQLVMISGIMDVSGRERSLRAATEFVAAIGVNVGAGMVLREGTRAVLKFFPGWGNVICGMVAGAGTYGLGRAAMAYFIEGLSLKDARQTYRAHRKRSAARKHLPARSSGRS
ncbi:MAG: YcjF family protein [Chthoniobacterales bacterium]